MTPYAYAKRRKYAIKTRSNKAIIKNIKIQLIKQNTYNKRHIM